MNNYDTLEKIIICNEREFKDNFWVSKTTFLILLEKTKYYNLDIKEKYLLLFLHYIKCYNTLDQLKTFHNLSQKTIIKYLTIVKEIFLNIIEKEPFKQEYRYQHSPLKINDIKIFSVVDTPLFPICKPNEIIEEIYYSAKHKCHGIKYEVVCSIADGHIIWISDNYYAGKDHDIGISRRSGLVGGEFHLKKNERILADKGYIGEPLIFVTPQKGDREYFNDYQKELEKSIFPFRRIIENVFMRIKACKILTVPFRADIDDFAEIIKVIFYIYNISLINNPLRKDKE